jgi:hypothetical protein
MLVSRYMRSASKLTLVLLVVGAIARDRSAGPVEPILPDIFVPDDIIGQFKNASPPDAVASMMPQLEDRTSLDPILRIANKLKHTWRTRHVDDCSEDERNQAIRGPQKRRALMSTSPRSYTRAQCIQCSDFVLVVLRHMGIDLDQPVRGNFAYEESRGSRKVTRYMMAGLQPEATLAVVQRLQGGQSDDALLRRFAGHDFQQGDRFGAGAALVDDGGQQVDLSAARPGDVQQTIGLPSRGRRKAHAGIVWDVKGCGKVWLGHSDSPITSIDAPQGPGWIDVPCHDPRQFAIISPTTAPELIGEFTTRQVRLIDANNKRGANGIRISNMYRQLKPGAVAYVGRAQSSRWYQDLDGTAEID